VVDYHPILATPTTALDRLLGFRAVHPLYGAFLIDHLGGMSPEERIQAFESVLELPRPLLKHVRVPWEFPAGPYQTAVLDPILIDKGLIAAQPPQTDDDDDEEEFIPWDERPPVFADKLRLLFDHTYPDVTDVQTQAVWAAGEVLQFGGNFNQYITHKDLAKQEGLIFRHLLRMILLLDEFASLTPPGLETAQWQTELSEFSEKLTKTCREVDRASTEETIKKAHAADVVVGEDHAKILAATETSANEPSTDEELFGAGLFEP
jgi:hypothetical protein